MISEIIYTHEQIAKTAKIVHELLSRFKILTFTGDLGAGKTTLVQALLRECAIEGPIQSPTFSYVNIYHNSLGQTFYHFDLYRINTLEDFKNAGFAEYLYSSGTSKAWAFIEWPEIIMPLLTHDTCHLFLEYIDQDMRKLLLLDKLA